ncbi:ABC transporter permease [Nocardioides bruguierae]|uniref:ABC transporter permease n=1 Tax=Nocardioides bruguierae TaxID=2945102 RepID=A0A9X2IGZ5_9ACTN|nr:ABC transporter permease [Nocardioides bruguierae]MCL8025209.1 ABC transporter permease [Nocardioides bruguierae]MCM0621280.1 ABC transporter permease [Nocardioides bruguierae]
MSTTAPASAPVASPDRVEIVPRKVPVILTVITVALALAVALGAQDGDTTFRLATGKDLFQLPDVVVPAELTAWIGIVVMALVSVDSWRRQLTGHRTPMWETALYAVVGLLAFLAWAAADGTIPMVGLLSGSLALAVPLVFGALGGVLGERAGVVNIAIEGQLLFGAFAAAIVGSLAAPPLVSALGESAGDFTGAIVASAGAAFAGMLVAVLLAVFAVRYFVEQVIVGVVLNVLVIGVTSFMFSQVLAPNAATLNSPPRFRAIDIPILGDIPLIGPVLFRQTLLVYALYVAVALVTFALWRTRWGLRLRAVGEHPKAADTVGIKVNRTRFRTVLLAGAIAGLGGASYTLVAVSQFNREMTGGAGYIALAAVIFGKWDPIRATLAALLFGFASQLQGTLSVIGSPVPSQFMLMLPYVVTLFAVAGLVGHSRPPAASGQPYKLG